MSTKNRLIILEQKGNFKHVKTHYTSFFLGWNYN